MSSEPRLDFLARFVAGLVAWVTRHPRAVLGVSLLFTLAAVHVAYDKLEYCTQRNDLISPNKPCQQRWQNYLATFGDDDDMVVVAEGSNRERMAAAIDVVAAKVKERHDLFDRVFYKVDLRHLRDRALCTFLPSSWRPSAHDSIGWSRCLAQPARSRGGCCRCNRFFRVPRVL